MPLLTNPSALYYGLERAEFRRAAEHRPEWRKYLFLEHADQSGWELNADQQQG